MAVRYINPEDHGRQIMHPVESASSSTWMPDLEKVIQMQSELTELQKRFLEARDFQRRCTFALALTACMSIGLSLLSFLRTFG